MARIESTRRHGHHDPRFGRLRRAAAPAHADLRKPSVRAIPPEWLTAVASWEGEGGAVR